MRGLDDATTVRLGVLRRKLDELRELDRHRRVFGASAHKYVESAVLDEPTIVSLQARYGLRLPDELRVFLQAMHAGGPGPGYGFLGPSDNQQRLAREPFIYGDADVAALVARQASDRWASLPLVEDDTNDWPPGSGFLSLAHLGCGVFDVIVAAGEQRGRIWCCDMAWRPHYRMVGAGLEQYGFFDWYEDWLDQSRAQL